MKLTPIFLLLFSMNLKAADRSQLDAIYKMYWTGIVEIKNDTTINGTFDGGGKILRISAIISGNCNLANWLIDANQFMQIFDTTVSIGNGCRIREFSGMWYGARAGLADNTRQIQIAINACISRFQLFWPRAVYNHNSPIVVLKETGGTYQQCSIVMSGEGTVWDNNTVFQYNGTDSFGFGVQYQKGTIIKGMTFRGRWVSPSTPDTVYFNTAIENYNNQGLGGNSTGVWIDPYGSYGQRSGSTSVLFEQCCVDKHALLVKISNGYMNNGEMITFDYFRAGDGRRGFEGSQPQEKYNILANIYSWGSIHTLFNFGIGTQSGNYYFNGANIAGRCIRVFNINSGGFFPSFARDIYSEKAATIGNIVTQVPFELYNSIFDNVTPDKVGVIPFITSNSEFTRLTNVTARYYVGGTPAAQTFIGNGRFMNCKLSGDIFNPGGGWKFLDTATAATIQGSQMRIKTAIKVEP